MSHGVKKETYVNADEVTTKALTFDLLNKLYEITEESKDSFTKQKEICGNRIKKLENNKKKNAAIASASGGVGGGLTMLGLYIKEWLAK